MPKLYKTLLFIYFIVSFNTFAQTTKGDSIKKDTVQRSIVTVASATGISVLIPQLTPKSPNVASLGRFGEYPVSMYTGLPTIEIPIFNIEVGGISQPIKLSYHASGIKVTDVASLVGLGWSLQYNSSVNRQMRGLADESNIGLLGKIIPVDIQASQGAICYNEDVRFYYQRIAENTLDTERDLFSLSMPSKSNQFILKDTTDYQWISPEPTKVQYSRTNGSFTVNDEGGNQYLFNEKEVTNGVGVSSWLISQAQGTLPQDKIIWEYYPVGNYSRTHEIIESITVNDNGTGSVPSGVTMTTPGSNPSPNLISVNNSVEQKLPKTIHFPSGKIEFVLEATDRQDGFGKALDKIEIYGYNTTDLAYQLIKTYDLTYVYRNRADGLPVLFLNEMKMLDKSAVEIGKYQLGYYTDVVLPAVQSKAKDFWGYYNGKTTNTTLVPAQNVAVIFYPGGTSGTVAIGGGNRQADENFMKAWVLNKITYPTGGYMEFDYQANRYLDGSTLRQAGGLRVLSVKSTANSTSPVVTKSYRYGINENGAGNLRQSLALQYNTEQKVISCQPISTGGTCSPIYSYRVRTYTSNLSGPLFPNEGSPVTYNTVTEYQDLGATGSNGKAISEFREASDNVITLNRGAKFFLNSRHWNRGQLLRKRVFGQDNLLKYRVENTYKVLGAGTTSDFCGRMAQTQTVYEGSRNQYLVGSSLCYSDVDDYQPAQIYFFEFGTTKLVQSDEYVYDNQDETKFTKKTNYTDYIPNYYFPRLTREIVNGGEIRGSKLFYPFDYLNIPATSTGELFAIRRLIEKNQINVPVEELSYLKSSLSATDSLISGAKLISLFSKENNSSGAFKSLFVAPKNIYLLESQAFGAFGTTPYQSSAALYNASPSSYTSNVPKHGLYEQKLSMNSYDNYGNLDSYTIINGRTDAFAYQDFLHDGVRLNYLSAQIQDDGIGTLNHTTFFNYTIPLLGLSSIQAPNGTFTYFNYDLFGRFKNAKDHNQNILKENAYDYTNRSVTEWMPRVALNAITASTPTSDALKTVSFVDGLGRDSQKIIVKASPDSTKDIVASSVLYDVFGRGYKSFLPSPSPSVGGVLVSTSALQTAAQNFYSDANPFTETTAFDNSPLNRPLTNFGAGVAWRTANKSMGMQYGIAPAGTIKRFKASTGAVFCNVEGQPTTIDYYGANELQKKVSTSERGKTITEYIDLQGRVIQKEVEVSADTILTTVYCYDIFDRLAYVIPPNAYKLFTSARAFILDTESDSKEGLYVYKFDRKGQQIQKRIPGQTDFEVMVYDRLYRMVLNRDAGDDQVLDAFGRSRFKFQKYDAINRPVMSGLTFLTQGFDRQTIQNEFDSQVIISESRIPPLGTGGLLGYTNLSFPVNYTPVDANVRMVNYFDNYNWQTNNNYLFQAGNAYETRWLNYYNGLNTGSLVRNIETLDWYRNVNYFDFKNRIIQAAVQNHVGGIDRLNIKYSFTGEILKAKKVHDKGTVASTITELSEYLYNHVGNKTHFFYTKDNLARQLIATYQYDKINRLNQKNIQPAFAVGSKQTGSWMNTTTWLTGSLPTISDFVTINTGHTVTIPSANTAQAGRLLDKGILNIQNAAVLQMGNATANPQALQNIDFSYHIRGAIKGINLNASGNIALNGGDLFSMKLGFEDSGFYDGNIGSQEWKSSLDNVTRSFTYRYDGASRIKAGIFGSSKTGENYSLNNVNYDFNGNITVLSRNGFRTNNSFGVVDNLGYSYNPNSNKIQKVDDLSNETASFTDATGGIDYTYYADGSLKSDANKGITLIEYNYLKLPKRIVKGSTIILNEYDASGTKLKETIGTQVTDYVVNKIYKNGSLYQISHGEGRIINGEYEYNIKDHLGNLRVAFRDSLGIAKITQANSYGIFGEDLPTLSYLKPSWKEDKFKFTGKEELQGTGYIDFGARLYDNLVPRFTTIDPLAEMSRRFSPYTYANNNPIRFIDPDGMATKGYTSASGYYSDDAGAGGEQENILGDGEKKPKKQDDKIEVVSPVKEKSLPVGTQVEEPIKSSWDNIQYYLLDQMLYYHDGVVQPYDRDGKISGEAGLPSPISVTSFLGPLKGTKFALSAFSAPGFKNFAALKRYLGGAGKGFAWHHIVEKYSTNLTNFGETTIHNVKNIVRLPASVHDQISAFYNSKQAFTGRVTVREWLSTKTYQDQYDYGVKIMEKLYKGESLK